MRNLLYLFLTLTFISCSKDDDNDPNSFTEKYNSIVWIGDESEVNDAYFISFSNSPLKIYTWETDLEGDYCFPINFGQPDQFGSTYTILENTLNNLLITRVSSDGEEENVICTVSNNDTALTIRVVASGEELYSETYSRSSSTNPCL